MPAPDATFAAPSPQQVHDHLQRHPLRAPSKLQAWLTLLTVALLAPLSLVAQGLWVVLICLAIFAFFLYTGRQAWRGRWLEQRTALAHELAVWQRHVEALRLAWRTLEQVERLPALHARCVAEMAASLGRLQAHEAAIVAYDYLLERLPAQHPGAVQFRAQRAIAELACDRMLDADRSLRSLRDLAKPEQPTPMTALYRFAELWQAVRTYRDQDAVDMSATLVENLRPLGVEAGYGYALAALAHHRLRQRQPEQAMSLLEQARVWWGRATLLVPPAQLAERLPEVAPLLAEAELASSTASHVVPLPGA